MLSEPQLKRVRRLIGDLPVKTTVWDEDGLPTEVQTEQDFSDEEIQAEHTLQGEVVSLTIVHLLRQRRGMYSHLVDHASDAASNAANQKFRNITELLKAAERAAVAEGVLSPSEMTTESNSRTRIRSGKFNWGTDSRRRK